MHEIELLKVGPGVMLQGVKNCSIKLIITQKLQIVGEVAENLHGKYVQNEHC